MNFYDLTKEAPYKPVTLAQTILGYKKSEAVKWCIKNLGYQIDKENKAELSMVRYIASGKKKFSDYFPEDDEVITADEAV